VRRLTLNYKNNSCSPEYVLPSTGMGRGGYRSS
jgi:hypothetical protein